jgi:hypothetical protein
MTFFNNISDRDVWLIIDSLLFILLMYLVWVGIFTKEIKDDNK